MHLAEKGFFGSEKDAPRSIWPRKAPLLAKTMLREGSATAADLTHLADLTDLTETARMVIFRV